MKRLRHSRLRRPDGCKGKRRLGLDGPASGLFTGFERLEPRTLLAVNLSLSGSPLAENGGVAQVAAILTETSAQDVTVALSFTGTATVDVDYTPSTTSIVIPAGSLS